MKTIKLLLIFSLAAIVLTVFGQTYEIYVSDAGNYNNPPWQVAKFDGTGDNPVTFNEDDVIWPQDIVILEEQEVVLVSSLTANGYISKHDIATGNFAGYFAEDINGPTRMKISGFPVARGSWMRIDSPIHSTIRACTPSRSESSSTDSSRRILSVIPRT